MRHSQRLRRPLGTGARLVIAVLVVVVSIVSSSSGAGAVSSSPGGTSAPAPWEWPLGAFRITEPYRQPAHRYGTGHRGIDLRTVGDSVVQAPAAGIVAFVGDVAGRAIVTIDHGGGLVSTLEPVTGSVSPGDHVEQGAIVGTLAAGGHTQAGELHLGARLDGEYINPLALLGGIPRAVLLPCC